MRFLLENARRRLYRARYLEDSVCREITETVKGRKISRPSAWLPSIPSTLSTAIRIAGFSNGRFGRSPGGMPDRPRKRVIGDLFPALLTGKKMSPPLELLDLGHHLRVVV